MHFTSPASRSAAVKRTVIADVVILMLSGACALDAAAQTAVPAQGVPTPGAVLDSTRAAESPPRLPRLVRRTDRVGGRPRLRRPRHRRAGAGGLLRRAGGRLSAARAGRPGGGSGHRLHDRPHAGLPVVLRLGQDRPGPRDGVRARRETWTGLFRREFRSRRGLAAGQQGRPAHRPFGLRAPKTVGAMHGMMLGFSNQQFACLPRYVFLSS